MLVVGDSGLVWIASLFVFNTVFGTIQERTRGRKSWSDECIDALGDIQFFSVLDANSRYGEIEVSKPDREKTSFSSQHGLHQFTAIPFGLKNAIKTFQHVMDIVLSNVKW